MKVLFYGRLAETLGPELEIEAQPGCSVADDFTHELDDIAENRLESALT